MDATPVLGAIAVAMALIMARIVLWASEARTRLAASVVVFLLAMMAAMFLGTLIYALSPGVGTLVLALWVAAAIMAVSVFPVFGHFVEELQARGRDGARYVPRRVRSAGNFALGVAGLVLVAELLMGRAFAYLIDGAPGAAARSVAGAAAAVTATFGSAWFVFPMAVEMAATWWWLRPKLPAAIAPVLLAQAATMALAPPALRLAWWPDATGGLSGAVAIGVYVYLAERLFGGGRMPAPVARYAVALVVALAVMAGGLVLWAATGDLALYAVSVGLQTLIYFAVVVDPGRFGTAEAAPPLPTEARPSSAGPA